MIMALVSAVLVALLALVVANDLYNRQAALGAVVVRREQAPRTYWLLIGLWVMCLVVSFAILMDALAAGPECVPEEGCQVIQVVVS